jgi:hypothetical protein
MMHTIVAVVVVAACVCAAAAQSGYLAGVATRDMSPSQQQARALPRAHVARVCTKPVVFQCLSPGWGRTGR